MALEFLPPSLEFSASDAIGPASDFARYFVRAGKPDSRWAIGPEVELFGFTKDDLQRINQDQVQAVMRGLSPHLIDSESEGGLVVAASLPAPSPGGAAGEPAAGEPGGGRVTLEPGGQVEFSGAFQVSLAGVERALRDYIDRLRGVGDRLGIIFLATGFDPLRSIREQKWVPKKRYNIMRPYLRAQGRRAWDMMCRTAALQVNLDYSDLEDLARKFTVANRLGPLAAALFANSPFEDGRLSGYKSTRYRAWLETDPDRTGVSPPALEESFSIERFIDYARSVPMLFIRRGGDYIDLAGHSFEQFLTWGAGDEQPLFQDFTDHLTTIFTEARLKPHIEQRSMDCNSVNTVMAAMAFWKGLLYDADSLEGALRVAPRLSRPEFARLQLEVARSGLEAKSGGVEIMRLAEQAIELARAGLKSRAPGEAHYLDALEEQVLKERICPADILIRNFQGSWGHSLERVVEHLQVR